MAELDIFLFDTFRNIHLFVDMTSSFWGEGERGVKVSEPAGVFSIKDGKGEGS